MSNNKIKVNKQRNRFYRSSRKKNTSYNSLHDSKIKNLFISGFGSVLNIFGDSSNRYPFIATDFEAISNDWKAVGQDIFRAMEDFELEHSDKLSSFLK